MYQYRWPSLLGAVAVCAVAFAAEDEKGFKWLAPNELVYQHELVVRGRNASARMP